MAETILVADDDPKMLRFVEINLRLHGFLATTAADGEDAVNKAVELQPDLVVLDVRMPKLDGYQVCRRLRINPRTSHIPIIMLTARSATVDKIRGLASGAADYIVKPFDPNELVARVQATLRRTSDLRDASPLTGLPGNLRIDAEIARRQASGDELAVIYADLNDFKAFNDRYGFLRGDDVIAFTGILITDAARGCGDADAFVGHVGGDDFMVICRPEVVTGLCERIIARFDARLPDFYDPVDAERGYVELPDRQGRMHCFPLVSIALGVATTQRRAFSDHREVIEVATEMKAFAKRRPGVRGVGPGSWPGVRGIGPGLGPGVHGVGHGSRRGSAYAIDERNDPP